LSVDADHILVGHAQREMACDLPREPSLRAGARIRFGDAGQAVEIEPGVGDVLIVDEPAQPFAHDIGRSAEARGLGFEVAPGGSSPRLRGEDG
jgi:hypothetical protein